MLQFSRPFRHHSHYLALEAHNLPEGIGLKGEVGVHFEVSQENAAFTLLLENFPVIAGKVLVFVEVLPAIEKLVELGINCLVLFYFQKSCVFQGSAVLLHALEDKEGFVDDGVDRLQGGLRVEAGLGEGWDAFGHWRW